jgi:hypothetical protein
MPAVDHQRPVAVTATTSSAVKDMGDGRSSTTSHVASSGAMNTHPQATPAAAPTAPAAKKGKGKKSADPVDNQKLLEQTMARLERSAAGDREQEIEIGKLGLYLFVK